MASKENIIDKIIRIRFPDYSKLQVLRTPDLLGQRKRYVLNEDDEKLLSNVEGYRSNLEHKSIEQCNEILKIERGKIEKEKRKKEEEQAEAKLFFEKTMLKAQAAAEQAAFEYWSKVATWTIEEGIFLINETDPRAPHGKSKETWANIKKLTTQDDYLLAERALEAGKLNATNPPLEFIAWAKQIGLSVPDNLSELVLKMQVKSHGGDNPVPDVKSTIRVRDEAMQKDANSIIQELKKGKDESHDKDAVAKKIFESKKYKDARTGEPLSEERIKTIIRTKTQNA